MNTNPITARRLGLAAILAILALGAGPVPAQHDESQDRDAMPAIAADDDDDFGPGGGRFEGRMGRRLGLTEGQQDAVAKIHEAGRARDLPLRKQLRQLRHDLKGEMMKDEPSEKAALAIVSRLGDVRTKLQSGRLSDRLAVRALLTEEQRERLPQWGLEGERGGRGERGGPRAGHMRGGRGGRGGPGCEAPACDGNGPGRGGPGQGPRGPRWHQERDAD
ncbi:MAG: Spy/CpxP family protein refolding chaperone [bacterium]|nr:Spy/CpxP family protein refolding chaperone [bacterium]